MLVSVNGIRQKTLCLHPTQADYDFTNSREACDLHLNKGHNTVCLSFVGDTVGVDYIQLNALECYRYYEQKDYSDVYYRIENKKTHNCISIASRYDSIPCVAEALPYKKTMSNSGYAWIIEVMVAGEYQPILIHQALHWRRSIAV